jgi:hypothetical protein
VRSDDPAEKRAVAQRRASEMPPASAPLVASSSSTATSSSASGKSKLVQSQHALPTHGSSPQLLRHSGGTAAPTMMAHSAPSSPATRSVSMRSSNGAASPIRRTVVKAGGATSNASSSGSVPSSPRSATPSSVVDAPPSPHVDPPIDTATTTNNSSSSALATSYTATNDINTNNNNNNANHSDDDEPPPPPPTDASPMPNEPDEGDIALDLLSELAAM